jgi:hypothetical protein
MSQQQQQAQQQAGLAAQLHAHLLGDDRDDSHGSPYDSNYASYDHDQLQAMLLASAAAASNPHDANVATMLALQQQAQVAVAAQQQQHQQQQQQQQQLQQQLANRLQSQALMHSHPGALGRPRHPGLMSMQGEDGQGGGTMSDTASHHLDSHHLDSQMASFESDSLQLLLQAAASGHDTQSLNALLAAGALAKQQQVAAQQQHERVLAAAAASLSLGGGSPVTSGAPSAALLAQAAQQTSTQQAVAAAAAAALQHQGQAGSGGRDVTRPGRGLDGYDLVPRPSTPPGGTSTNPSDQFATPVFRL